jgi:ABC-type glucose/galactose transport system permease subunit
MQNLANITGAPVQGAVYAQQGGAQNIYGLGGPSLFESSGLLSLTNQNAMAQMNAAGQAGMVNAQSAGASRGQMIGAGAAIAGTVLTSAVLL